MAKHSSRELPVASWVYTTSSEDGKSYIRAANFFQPTLLYDTFYGKSARELGTSAYDGIRNKLIRVADLKHLDGIAYLLSQQHQIFSMFGSQFSEYATEENLPQELVKRFFINTTAKYKEWAFAEQPVRLQQLKEATGSQLDLLEALKNPDDAKFRQMVVAYEGIHNIVRAFADITSDVSRLYDANLAKLYGDRVPADLVKFGEEPEIIVPEIQEISGVDRLISAVSEVARDPVFVARIHRRRKEAFNDLTKIMAEIVQELN